MLNSGVGLNLPRPENSTYVCGKYGAPQALCGLGAVPVSDKKPDLKESPGIRSIFNCKAGDGYWTSSHMMVQSNAMGPKLRAGFHAAPEVGSIGQMALWGFILIV